MKLHAKVIFGVAGVLLLAGCANQPLLFASGITVGVDIGINGASTNPVNLTVGYKQLDATLVPVTATDASGSVHPIRGCSGSAAGSSSATGCSVSPTENQVHASENQVHASGNSAPTENFANIETLTRVSDGIGSRGVNAISDTAASSVPPPPGGFGDQTESMNDALSVYSSFDADIVAKSGSSANAGVNFGKVFATGVASQNLSAGQRAYANYKGQALAYGPAAMCIAQLTNALNAGGKSAVLTEEMVKVCMPPAAPAPKTN